jgi:8-oxo-dGTP pyrophosphatase MutT (NUDIX family)
MLLLHYLDGHLPCGNGTRPSKADWAAHQSDFILKHRYGTTPTVPGEYRDGDTPLARPKDAATLIVVRGGTHPRLLMGKRASTHSFMPNKFVFPGGRLDFVDQRLRVRGELHSAVLTRLRKATRKEVTDRKLRGLALAAIRETFEETGLIIGRETLNRCTTRHPIWLQYLRHGVEPPLESMDFFARAITPAYRTRRFDTRFFMIHDEFIYGDPEHVAQVSGELNEIHWLTFAEARELDLPAVTRWAMDIVEQRLQLTRDAQQEQAAPFMRFSRGNAVSVDL